MDIFQVFIDAFSELVTQLITWIPTLIIAWIIWWVGVKLLMFGANLLRRVNLPNTSLDDKVIEGLIKIIIPVGKFILILIVLDYLGIGSNVINAVVTGLTLTVAIALGISFGKALEPEAASIVKMVKKQLK